MAPSELAALRALIEDSTKSLTALINYNRDELLAKFEEVKTELTAVKSVATAQSKEIFILKTKMNEFEQQDKARSLRIFGLRITKEDDEALGTNKAVVKRIYDRIVKPILTIAKSKNMIDSVPQLGNCLVEGYRVGPPPKSDSATPPLVVKFLTKEIRDVVLKLKRENPPPPQPRGEGCWSQEDHRGGGPHPRHPQQAEGAGGPCRLREGLDLQRSHPLHPHQRQGEVRQEAGLPLHPCA